MKNFIAILILLFCQYISAQEIIYFPPTSGTEWETLDIETLEWCPSKIDSLYYFLENIDTKSFIVLKNGKIVLEKYFGTYTIDSTFSWYSAAKSFRAVLIGKAQEDNYLDLNDKTSDYLGVGWTSLTESQEDSITIKHQLSMTSGLDETNFLCVNPLCLNYVVTAGSRWVYHNGPYSLTKNVLEEATGLNHNVYSNNTIEDKIGMQGLWLTFLGSSSYYSNARDMARFGLLILNEGVWGNDTLLHDTSYFNEMISPSQNLNPSYGYLWWLNGESTYISPSSPDVIMGSISPDAPADAFVAAGSFGQFISISPDNNLIMIRQGLSENGDLTEFEMHNEIWKQISHLNCISTPTSEILIQELKVYPNPLSNGLKIEGLSNGLHDITIYNLLGKSVLNASVMDKEVINISELDLGIYFLKVDDGKKYQSVKIVKGN